MIFLFFFLTLTLLIKSAEVPTNCNQQLHNYYVSLGMPMVTPVLAAINLTQGTLGPVSFVTASIDIQGVARYYASLLPNATGANYTWDVDLTLDIPWCTSEVLFECCDNISTGTAKSSNCTTISDFDAGGSNPVAGRFYIFLNQTYPCQGNPKITFYNTSIDMGGTGTWTYEAIGIRDQYRMSYQQARINYRNSKCLFTDGDPADMVDQNIFVCTMPLIACNGTRENGLPSLEVIPLPMYQCIGQTEPNGTTKVVVGIYNIQPPNGIQGYFSLAFTRNINSPLFYEQTFGLGFEFPLITIPNTRRQFVANFDDFDFYSVVYYQGRDNAYKPVYPFSRDPKLMAVPCVCDFSMDCLVPGTADTTSDATFQLSVNNAVPVCYPGPPLIISLGTPNFTLNATGSFDPDNGPGIFGVYWGIYSTPYGSNPPFNLTSPQSMTITIDSTNLTAGNYIFILWTGDQQAITVCTWNVTILSNQVFAVIYPSYYSTVFDFYSGAEVGHECSIYPPSPAIPLNGTRSYATVPNTTICYSWIQTNGPAIIYSCDDIGFFTTRAFFNTTEAVAWFVPSTVGEYCFQLTVGDCILNSSTALTCITVQPDFGQPNSTYTPILNYTDPPLRNLTQNETQNITFPPSTPAPFEPFAPVAPPPTGTIVVPPLIIIQPNATRTEIIGLFLGGIAWVIIGVFLYVVWLSYGNVVYTGYLQRRTWGGDSA